MSKSAQKRVEGNNFDIRKHLLQYDNVMNEHREIIYRKRNEILDQESIHENVLENLKNYVNNNVFKILNSEENNKYSNLVEFKDDIVRNKLAVLKTIKINF